jgi:endonuclease/exonuclease/phosphatase family metal-dependent hydrolase
MRIRVNPQHLIVLETAVAGLFFIQALRFLVGALYSRVAGAAAVAAGDLTNATGLPGVTSAQTVNNEVLITALVMLLPLLALILGRWRPLFVLAAVALAGTRFTMISPAFDIASPVPAALTVGTGLLYLALLIRHHLRLLPYFFILGLSIDQVLRAVGNTLDPSWSANSALFAFGTGAGAFVFNYFTLQLILSVALVLLAILTYALRRRLTTDASNWVDERGMLPFWGAIGLGALLFLQVSLLALPNAIAGRAGVDYTTFVPLVLLATTLPLVPWVRAQGRGFVALFDPALRGWIWLLLVALLVVLGARFNGLIAGASFVLAQFGVCMMWWWLARPQAEKERGFTGLWLLFAVAVFAFLAICDYFTYEYAYVRDFSGDFAFLNPYIPPLLRGFRGMGLGVVLLAIFLATIPMTQTRRRIPWAEGRRTAMQSILTILMIALLSFGAALAARPPVIQGVRGVDSFRTGTYNINAGYNEFYVYNLEAVANTIQQSGANVVMLQEAEAGRMTSFGVDQPLWLARRLGMDRRFLPTNEGLYGLATLSNVPIVYHQGTLLPGIGQQTGVQHVQVSTDGGVSAVAFYNTWLGLLLDLGNDQTLAQQEQDQQRQLSAIFSRITSDYPDLNRVRIVVGGTFNNVPGSPLIEQMRVSGFTDPFAGLPGELSATLWRTNARARFDYLWARNVLPLGALVMESNASDHRMAVVEILINRQLQ